MTSREKREIDRRQRLHVDSLIGSVSRQLTTAYVEANKLHSINGPIMVVLEHMRVLSTDVRRWNRESGPLE
jgi:hypothetical protein